MALEAKFDGYVDVGAKKPAVTIFSLLSVARIFFANMYALSLKCWLINRLANLLILLFINCLEINLPSDYHTNTVISDFFDAYHVPVKMAFK